MLFLVQGTVSVSEYMSSTRSFKDLKIVDANDMTEAIGKYKNFWQTKSRDYSTSYYVDVDDISGVIQ